MGRTALPRRLPESENVHVEMGAASHVGRVRHVNEDSLLSLDAVAAVADGMGGHAAGDVASALAIQALSAGARPGRATQAAIREGIAAANQAILDEVTAHPERAGMGTTITGIALVEYAGSPHWMVFNVGDSRVYRIADGRAVQLTVDHSEVAELLALGRITAAEAVDHPLRNVVTRSLGTAPAPDVDSWIFPPEEGGDRFVVCSDGLFNELDDATIARLAHTEPVGAAASALVEAAVAAGGRDNVTVVVVAHRPAEDDELTIDTLPRRRFTA